MFGRGHFNAGVLVDPKPDHKFDPSDPEKLSAFRNKIWSVYYGLFPDDLGSYMGDVRDCSQENRGEAESARSSALASLQRGVIT